VHAVVSHLAGLDGRFSEEVTDLRWWPLTHLMEWLSAWWVKGPLFVLAALACDLVLARRAARGTLPWRAALTLAAVLLGSLASTLAKPLFDRPRPPLGDAGISAIGSLPTSASFPSGHATTAFAAATALALLRPGLRWWALALAAGVAISRVYLGMHYAGDVAAGAVLGVAVGGGLVHALRRLSLTPPATA
jgi:undecaprenyl-diphosphatase